MKELRTEVKRLMKEFKDAQRAQKSSLREARQAKHAATRAMKKERRATRKEERRAKREKRRGKNKDEERLFPPCTAAKLYGPQTTFVVPPVLQPQMPSGPGSGYRAFPFNRAATTPLDRKPSCPRVPPGIAALHGGWPFTQGGPYAPGCISVPNLASMDTDPIANGAGSIHAQAMQMDHAASVKEASATNLRVTATAHDIGEKERLKMADEASSLEEEAEKFRREGHRLRAEAMHLDSELARELEDGDGGQISGVVGK